MSFGITSTGFIAKRMPDIVTELEAIYRQKYGDDVDLSAGSLFGTELQINALQETEVWEQLEAAYNALYPSTASGIALDKAVQYSEITRLPATRSIVPGALKGTDGTIIPSTFQAAIENTNTVFNIDADMAISKVNTLSQIIYVETIGTVYTFRIYTIDGIYDATVNTTGLTTKAQISAAIAAYLVDAAMTNYFTQIDFLNGAVYVQSSNTSYLSFETSDSKLSLWSPANFTAENVGPAQVSNFSLNSILTPVSGLDAVNNFYPATAGRSLETDDALRLRRLQSIQKPGSATLDGMHARVLNDLANVSDCIVNQNNTGSADLAGNPAHSVQFVIDGTVTNQEVFDFLWSIVAGGIQTYGDITGTVIDSQGNSQSVSFSRPSGADVRVNVIVTSDPQSVFPTGGDLVIANNIVVKGNTLTLGKNILVQNFISEVFKVPGVGSVILEMSINDGVSWSGTEITVAYNTKPRFSTANVTVTVV